MNVPEMLKVIGEQIQACATGKLAFAEPVSIADRMVIPVAWVRYDFGAGGGGPAVYRRMTDEGGGGGGGGQVSVVPAGIIELTPTGTRFIPIPDSKKIFALIASSFGNAAGMNHSGAENTGNNMSEAPNKSAARRGAGKGTSKEPAEKGSTSLAKKVPAGKAVSINSHRPLARKAISKTPNPARPAAKKKTSFAAARRSTAKQR